MQIAMDVNTLSSKLVQIQLYLRENLVTNPSFLCSPIQKYPKMMDLQKQNQILTYQLKLLANLISKLQIRSDHHLYQLNIKECNDLIKCLEENKNLQTKLQKSQIECKRIKQQKDEIFDRCEDLQRKIRVLQKTMVDYEKLGGVSKIRVQKQIIKQLREKNEEITKQMSQKTSEIKSMKNRCKILQDLNRQTEQKLSDALCKNLHKTDNKQNIQNNTSQTIKKMDKSLQLQMLASKQQTKRLKWQIQQLKVQIEQVKREKKQQRSRHKEKQNFYEKMAMRKTNLELD